MEPLDNIAINNRGNRDNYGDERFLKWNINDFINKYIYSILQTNELQKEHCWYLVKSIKDDKTLICVLENEPITIYEFSIGDTFEVKISDIEKIFYDNKVFNGANEEVDIYYNT